MASNLHPSRLPLQLQEATQVSSGLIQLKNFAKVVPTCDYANAYGFFFIKYLFSFNMKNVSRD